MRTKIFAMSMGLAASVWLTGCQSTGTVKTVTIHDNHAPTVAKSARENRDSLHADMNRPTTDIVTEKLARLTSRPKLSPTVAVESHANGAKCGHCGADLTARAAPTAVSCTSGCPAKTGSGIVGQVASAPAILPESAQTIVTMPPAPNQQFVIPAANGMPQPVIVQHQPPVSQIAIPPMSGETIVVAAPMQTQPPLGASYGPGVEVVSGQPFDGVPIASCEKMVANSVMTDRFGQANNYQTVVGQVYQFRRAWKLRYTAVESDDRYGGSLTLVGDNLDNLKDRQMVRVEGAVLPTDDRAGSVRYQVSRVEIIEPNVK